MLGSFNRWSARHDSQQVDLAFVVDCTGSMGSYISQTQRNITFIAETISRTAFNVRFALVEYRDHPPQDQTYVSRNHDFTSSVSDMKGWCKTLYFFQCSQNFHPQPSRIFVAKIYNIESLIRESNLQHFPINSYY